MVAESYPTAAIGADNDESKTGELAAIRTGLQWTMPGTTGMDFNDMHLKCGLLAVTDALREVFVERSM
jgi:hypothetical protein